MANAGLGDWILCQITSQRYTDLAAVEITNSDFINGSLTKTSYARPAKLFTASAGIIRKQIGELTNTKFDEIRKAVIFLFEELIRDL